MIAHERVQRVQRFYVALGHALRDRELQDAGAEVQFYFDADVTIDTVIGLTSWAPLSVPDVSSLRHVVRALLSTGFLPSVRFLRPHLIEFESLIRRLPDTPMAQGFHKAVRNHLIRQWQLSSDEEDLRRRLSVDEGNGFYEFVRENGFGVFVKLELCLGGTWRPRLHRLLHDGQFQFAGDGHVDLPHADDDLVKELASRLSFRRSPEKHESSLLDAFALSELSRKVDRGVHARFYTETAPLRQMFSPREPKLRRRLSENGRSILRTEEYFLIRSSFPALEFPPRAVRKHGLATSPTAGLFTLPLLGELHRRLDHILRALKLPQDGPRSDDPRDRAVSPIEIDAALDSALKEVPAGEGNLAELLDRFYNLSFLDTVFLEWMPDDMQAWLPGLYEVKSQGPVVSETRRKLGMSMDGLWDSLHREIGQLRSWRVDFRRLMTTANHRARYAEGQRPSVDVDLGLGRWGIEERIEDDLRDRLEEGIAALLDDTTRELTASSFAMSLAFRAADPQEFAYQVYLLWFLGADDLILRVFEQAPPTVVAQIPPWLDILRLISETKTAASKLRRGTRLDDRLSEIAAASRSLVEEAPRFDWDPGFAEMGCAHVCYWAWQVLGLDPGPRGQPWATASFEAAARARNLLEVGSLGWAFAVNHCAYIGIRAGIFRDRTEESLQTLLESIPKHWKHYRFTDTEVRASTESMNREIHEYGNEALLSLAELAEKRRGICKKLAWARNRLQEKPHWGDNEVVQHLNAIQRHIVDLRCPDA